MLHSSYFKCLILSSFFLFFQDGLFSLLPRVVDLVGECDIPVIAAGGIVDARGYVAALSLGAQGVCLGTRCVCVFFFFHLFFHKFDKLI